MFVTSHSTFSDDIIIGSNQLNLITFNSKLSNFIMHNGASFTNTSDKLIITYNNTFLDTQLTTNSLYINNNFICHNRTEYNDYEDLERKRTLIRTWINL